MFNTCLKTTLIFPNRGQSIAETALLTFGKLRFCQSFSVLYHVFFFFLFKGKSCFPVCENVLSYLTALNCLSVPLVCRKPPVQLSSELRMSKCLILYRCAAVRSGIKGLLLMKTSHFYQYDWRIYINTVIWIKWLAFVLLKLPPF